MPYKQLAKRKNFIRRKKVLKKVGKRLSLEEVMDDGEGWQVFARYFLAKKYTVTVIEARTTRSKYVVVYSRSQAYSYRVRFSDHRKHHPLYEMMDGNDCVVGEASHFTSHTLGKAIEMCEAYLERAERIYEY